MATNFPSSLDSFTNPTSSDTLASVPHASQHADANDAIEAIEAKVGVDSSTSTSTLEVRAPSIVTSTTRPSAVAGRLIYETDTKRHMVYIDGTSQWQPFTARTGNKNAIINGDFTINQRGFSSTTTGGTYGFDRWVMYKDTGTVTYSTQAFTVGTYPTDGYVATNYARIVTSGQSGANALAVLNQSIEDVRTFNNQVVTVSFWARAGSGTPKVAVELEQIFGTGGSPSSNVSTAVGQVTLSTSWARYSLTVAVPSISGKTLGTDSNSSRLQLVLFTSAGTNYNARTNSMGIQSATIDFWGVQIERGPVATDFEQRPIGQEILLCKRYYERVNRRTWGIFTSAGTTCRIMVECKVPMRIKPVATLTTTSLLAEYWSAAALTGSGSSVLATDGDNEGVDLTIGGFTGRSLGQAAMVKENQINLDAEY